MLNLPNKPVSWREAQGLENSCRVKEFKLGCWFRNGAGVTTAAKDDTYVLGFPHLVPLPQPFGEDTGVPCPAGQQLTGKPLPCSRVCPGPQSALPAELRAPGTDQPKSQPIGCRGPPTPLTRGQECGEDSEAQHGAGWWGCGTLGTRRAFIGWKGVTRPPWERNQPCPDLGWLLFDLGRKQGWLGCKVFQMSHDSSFQGSAFRGELPSGAG